VALGGIGFGLGEIAKGDASNLGGGVLIAHHPAGMVYSVGPPRDGWCAKYLSEFAITSAEQQVNRTDTVDAPVFWFVLSAWYEPKAFRGVEFGLGDYDTAAFAIIEHGACGGSRLEIPSDTWPGPNSGTSLAARAGSDWMGNYVPIYHFVGYAYAPGTRIELAPRPDTEFAGWVNCAEWPSKVEAVCLGALGILQDGVFCAPPPPGEIPGACCMGEGVCQLLLQGECVAAGGTWNGSATCTEWNSCPRAGACCLHDERTGDETCRRLTRDECRLAGGLWHVGEACDRGFTCPPIRACCRGQDCTLTSERDCRRGIWIPNAISCTSPGNPCVLPYVCCIGETCCLVLMSECARMCGVPRPEWDFCGPPSPCPGTPAAPRTPDDFMRPRH
jgi:hypothetical protein